MKTGRVHKCDRDRLRGPQAIASRARLRIRAGFGHVDAPVAVEHEVVMMVRYARWAHRWYCEHEVERLVWALDQMCTWNARAFAVMGGSAEHAMTREQAATFVWRFFGTSRECQL